MARWRKGARAVQFLISRGRLESFAAADLAALADAQIARAALRLEATAAMSGVRALLAKSPPERFS